MNRNINENNTIIMPEMINVLIIPQIRINKIPEVIDIGTKMDVKKLSIPKYLPYISHGTILCAEVNQTLLEKSTDMPMIM